MTAGSARSSWRSFPANARLAVATIRAAAPRDFRTMLLTAVLASLSLMAMLFAAKQLIQELAGDSPPSLADVLPTVMALAAATAVSSITATMQTEQRWLVGYAVERQTTQGLVAAASSVPLAEFESPEFQDHLQRSLQQSVNRPWELAQGISMLASSVLASAAITVVLLTVQPLLVPAIVLVGLPAAWAATRNSKTLFEAMQAVTPLNRQRLYVQEVLSGRDEAKEVRAFASGGYLRGRYEDLYARELDALRRAARLRIRRSFVASIISTAILVGVLLALIVLIVRGSVGLADGAIAVVAVQQLAGRVSVLTSSVGSIQEASLFLDDYADFLARVRPLPAEEPPAAAAGAVVDLDDVWFTYPGAHEPALRGVSLHVAQGEVVALVGANGSGKTTIAKLACGLYSPQAGQVRWGEGVKPRTGVIFQDFIRYQLSALENITLGDTSRIDDLSRAEECARAASAGEFLDALPDGYRTSLSPVFEGGTDLSVGQWQRVAMARALFRDPAVLLLDEPTAALDPAAERELIESTRRSFADKAVLVISHRFANVVDADRIYVLAHGQVVEHGTHGELMALGGQYAAMYRVQAATFGVDVDA